MTRHQAALMIGWLAFAPGTLLLCGNADAIPGTPGQPTAGATTTLPGLPASPENANDRPQALSIQFGRRMAAKTDILGKTDGIRVDYRLNNGVTLRGIAGYPAVSSKDEFNTARQMFGFSADTGMFAQAWDVNAYLIDEQDNAQLDNLAIGGTLRYRRSKRSLLVFVDYDANQERLNAITASGAWKLPGRTTLSATFDVHNNATQKRQKKHLQHSMASFAGWNWILPDDRIKHHASKQTRKVTTHGLSLSRTFSERFKLSSDIAMLDISNTRFSQDMAPPAALPNEYFYRLKLTGKDLLIPGNRNKLDIRHRITGSSRISTASLDTHYVINPLWKFSPRLRTELRDNVTGNSSEWVTSPAVKMEYRWKDAYGFQIEAGGKWSNQAIFASDTRSSTYFMKLGYQAKF